MENQNAADSVITALKSGLITYLGGKAMEKAFAAILKVPAVQELVRKFGCEAEGFVATLIKKLIGGCFVAGTEIWLARQDASGQWHVYSKPIEQVKAGDTVTTRDPQTGRTEYKRAQMPIVRTVGSVLSLALADSKTGKLVETITTTEEHPFRVAGQGFVPAGQLALGNAIVTRAGPALVVKSITRHTRKEGYLVYNFEVEGDHTYFVGTANGGAWVHNVTCPPGAAKVDLPEVTGPQVRAGDASNAWDNFLGNGPVNNIHPRLGTPHADRLVTQTGPNVWRSIRFGNHEMSSYPTHYHEEIWTYNPASHSVTISNTRRYIQPWSTVQLESLYVET